MLRIEYEFGASDPKHECRLFEPIPVLEGLDDDGALRAPFSRLARSIIVDGLARKAAFRPRLLMAFAIVGMFGFALYRDPMDTLIVDALIFGFATAIDFYLGGSRVGSIPQQ